MFIWKVKSQTTKITPYNSNDYLKSQMTFDQKTWYFIEKLF
jgi:hypothetical protein